MADSLFDRLDMRHLPTGRRTFSANHVLRIAEGVSDEEIAQAARACVEHDLGTLEMEAQWDETRGQSSTARGEARRIDGEIDALLSSTHQIAKGQLTHPRTEVAEAAQSYLDAVFPLGLGEVLNQQFEDELGWLKAMSRRFTGPMADVVSTLNFADHIARLDELVEAFETELAKHENPISFDEVKEARRQGDELLARLVFKIMSKYADDPEMRSKLMAEIDRQNKLVGEAFRHNNYPTDIDPDTGEPVPAADDVVDPQPVDA